MANWRAAFSKVPKLSFLYLQVLILTVDRQKWGSLNNDLRWHRPLVFEVRLWVLVWLGHTERHSRQCPNRMKKKKIDTVGSNWARSGQPKGIYHIEWGSWDVFDMPYFKTVVNNIGRQRNLIRASRSRYGKAVALALFLVPFDIARLTGPLPLVGRCLSGVWLGGHRKISGWTCWEKKKNRPISKWEFCGYLDLLCSWMALPEPFSTTQEDMCEIGERPNGIFCFKRVWIQHGTDLCATNGQRVAKKPTGPRAFSGDDLCTSIVRGGK